MSQQNNGFEFNIDIDAPDITRDNIHSVIAHALSNVNVIVMTLEQSGCDVILRELPRS